MKTMSMAVLMAAGSCATLLMALSPSAAHAATAHAATAHAVVATSASAALAASPPKYCAIVGAPAPGPNAASPILGQGCFATQAAETAFAQSTAAAAPNAALSPFAPASSIHLGVGWSGLGATGNRLDFYGAGGNCLSNYYSFANLHGPFDSATDDLLSGADCYDAYWHSGSDFGGRQWDCTASFTGGNPHQSCGGAMPTGDIGAGHSVRFRH